jgi:hypothetical protein
VYLRNAKKKIYHLSRCQIFPFYDSSIPPKPKNIFNECCHNLCKNLGSKLCPECPEICCDVHSYHSHYKCCAIDNGISCTKYGRMIYGDDVLCEDHYEQMVYPRCYQCGWLLSGYRKDYLYCIECKDENERKRHGYWYALRHQGVSGPYGEGFKKK